HQTERRLRRQDGDRDQDDAERQGHDVVRTLRRATENPREARRLCPRRQGGGADERRYQRDTGPGKRAQPIADRQALERYVGDRRADQGAGYERGRGNARPPADGRSGGLARAGDERSREDRGGERHSAGGLPRPASMIGDSATPGELRLPTIGIVEPPMAAD